MGNRHVRYRFDFLDTENSQIGPPSVKPEQGIVIGAEVRGRGLPRNDPVEHSAESRSIDILGLDRESDDPPGELVHDHQHPVGL